MFGFLNTKLRRDCGTCGQRGRSVGGGFFECEQHGIWDARDEEIQSIVLQKEAHTECRTL